MVTAEEAQRDVARVMLGVLAERGFALAGSGAIREHGIIQRPTADVDLFTEDRFSAEFEQSFEAGVRALRQRGCQVTVERRAAQFARFGVRTPDDHNFDIDMGVDWRAHDPVWFAVGPVLHVEDAVANKVCALFGRAAPRDFLDVDSIRRSGRFTDEALIESARDHGPGFDTAMFAQQLGLVDRLYPEDVAIYRCTADELAGVQARLRAWAHDLRGLEP